MDFAQNAKLILEHEFWGLYNMVCGGITGRLEVAQEMLRVLSLEEEIEINEVNSSYFAKEYFAERPSSERLVNSKLNLRELNVMRDWKLCLKEYLHEHYVDYLKDVKSESR